MPGDRSCSTLLLPHRSSDLRKKKKERNKAFATVPELKELGVQARESMRWEGVLQDPQEEAKRLERYRANRRQRYITHREAALKETQQTLREAELKTSAD
ncbi:hypothetical protein XENOCAPTIV_011066 [Xenoophorus captivus]|uniref:Uncharacterized protein n=1 Tax=Xenoophorus captivus TaxID=1517983 RepID=A0ABV0RPZ1_9TELE